MRQCSFWAARQRGSEAARQRGSGAARQRDSEAAGLRGCGAAGLRGCGAAWLRGCEAARRTSPLCVGYHRRSRRSLIRYRYHHTLQVFEKYFTSTQMYFESVMNTTLLASTTVGSSLKESSRFCPTQTWDAPSSELSAEQRLKRESVRFVVSFLDGLSDYIVDTVVSSTDSRLELSTKFSSAVSGEVATRSTCPCAFMGLQVEKSALALASRIMAP